MTTENEQQRVLVIEDDEDINELVVFNLESAGFVARGVFKGLEGISLVQSFQPHLILLDVMLPDTDGFEVCRRLKKDPATSAIPVVMLTAKGEDSDIILGLELGAADYIPKPFSFGVLLARIRAALRNRSAQVFSDDPDTKLTIGGLVIDDGRRSVTTSEGDLLSLTATEFDVLRLLAGRPGWVFSRAMIIDRVKGDDYPVTERSVDVQIVSLRKKLGARAGCIETVRGIGYRFAEET